MAESPSPRTSSKISEPPLDSGEGPCHERRPVRQQTAPGTEPHSSSWRRRHVMSCRVVSGRWWWCICPRQCPTAVMRCSVLRATDTVPSPSPVPVQSRSKPTPKSRRQRVDCRRHDTELGNMPCELEDLAPKHQGGLGPGWRGLRRFGLQTKFLSPATPLQRHQSQT